MVDFMMNVAAMHPLLRVTFLAVSTLIGTGIMIAFVAWLYFFADAVYRKITK